MGKKALPVVDFLFLGQKKAASEEAALKFKHRSLNYSRVAKCLMVRHI